MIKTNTAPDWNTIAKRIELYKLQKKAILDYSISEKELDARVDMRDKMKAQLKEDLQACIAYRIRLTKEGAGDDYSEIIAADGAIRLTIQAL